jgi:deazaflavin-dependent oxidoreductase (nitroreductase family)
VRTVLIVVAVAGGVLALLALGFVAAFRSKFGPVMRTIRRFNRAVANPMQLRGDAGQPGAYAGVVHHVGRRSGTSYRTPVSIVAGDGELVAVLPYGPDTDWLRNLVAAGGGAIEHEGRRWTVGAPEVVDIAEVDARFPAKDQRTHRRFGVREAVRLPVLAPTLSVADRADGADHPAPSPPPL